MNRRELLTSTIAAIAGRLPGREDTVFTYRSSVDGSDQPYALYAPPSIIDGKPYGLVVSLHGAGQDHHRGLRQCLQNEQAGCLVMAPLGRGSMGYEGIAETDVYDAVEDVKKRFCIDTDRVYLTGVSMGGSGSYSLAIRRPDVWAAVAPVCGGAPEGLPELSENAANLPFRIRHGDRDDTVPLAVARAWRERLQQAGALVDYQEYAGAGHNIAPRAYAGGETLRWLEGFRRAKFPARVRFAAREHACSSAYGVKIDRFTPGKVARIDARFSPPNELDVHTQNLSGFSVERNLRRASRVLIDGEPLSVSADAPWHFACRSNAWRQTETPYISRRSSGCDGPVKAVFSREHAYVFGTADVDAGSDAAWRRREIAQRAADWAGWKARPAVSFPAMSDAELLAAKWTGNVVLFGTRKTNLVLQRLTRLLPLQLREEHAAAWGLAFVYPVEGHLAIVSSGLPWWTGANRAQRESFRWQWLALPYRLASTFPDFVLFKESIDNVQLSGYFDEDWRLSDEMRATLAASQVIEL